TGDLVTADVAAVQGVFDVAIFGLLAAVQEALPDLKASKEGAVLVTNGAFGEINPQIDEYAVGAKAMGLALANAAKHKLVGLLAQRLKGDGVYVGEVMVAGIIKGTPWDNGNANLDGSTIANKFWELYQARKEGRARISRRAPRTQARGSQMAVRLFEFRVDGVLPAGLGASRRGLRRGSVPVHDRIQHVLPVGLWPPIIGSDLRRRGKAHRVARVDFAARLQRDRAVAFHIARVCEATHTVRVGVDAERAEVACRAQRRGHSLRFGSEARGRVSRRVTDRESLARD